MKRCVLVLFSIFLFFSSCVNTIPEHFALISTASFAVPCMFQSDMKNADYKVLEKDNYGRVFFSLTGYCLLSDTEETVLVIMQKYDEEYVYFYEDICYSFENRMEETKKQIKNLNDWNLPIDETKFSKRRVDFTLDNYLILDSNADFSKIKNAWEQCFKESNASIIDYTISDYDGEKCELYIVVIENESKEKEYYFSIVDVDSYKIQYMKIENITDFSENLKLFKQSCDWQY